MSSPCSDDDYYDQEKKRIAEEAKKAHQAHEREIFDDLSQMIPFYADADMQTQRLLLIANNILLNRFDEPGMVYWSIFEQNPAEIEDYADIFENDLGSRERSILIDFLLQKKEEEKL